MAKRVLVTGANGQLAKTIKKLYEHNADGIEFIFLPKEELDITDNRRVKKVFEESKFDYCINCAAYTNVEQAEKTPEIAYKVNAEGVKNIALACKQNDTILIHISTDYVFDGEKNEGYTEEDTPNPINEYGRSKLLGEQHIQQIFNKYFIIRTSWLYSKEFGSNFYRMVLDKISNGETLTITNDQKGCPTNVVNLARLIYKIVLNDLVTFGIKHFCDEEVFTWYEFAKNILQKNNFSDRINLVKAGKYLTFAKRPKNSILLNTIK